MRTYGNSVIGGSFRTRVRAGWGGLLCLVNGLGRKGQLEVPDRSGPDRAETRPRGCFPSFLVLGRETFLTPV